MSTPKKRLIINKVTVNLGCSSCRRPKLSTVFNPKPKRKIPTTSSSAAYHNPNRHYYSSSGCSWDTNTTTFSPEAEETTPSDTESDIKSLRAVQGFGKIGGESVAVEKDSDDPYLDFRQSMLQMILEKEIYSKNDLKELLNCFLQLNSPHYHGIIVRAFTEIWNGVFSVKSSSSYSYNSPNLHGRWKSRDY
ncbi:hypothetical protein M9H77_14784 [Catharanthus roseus]|uniref:Uncharacterized protein n=1 Tax=Catharanthus roseus TaxID=4058 RepID=A0ACC0BP08_CATRO|nr:hypothetical protein M9H77_14784 [Catharanthus roseus]